MVDLGTAGILAKAGTGFFVLLAGLVALASASPRRHTVSFSIFLVLWGGFLLAGNFASLAITAGKLAQGQELLMIHSVLQGIAYLPLLVFTLSYPPSRRVDLDRWSVMALLLAPAGAVLATALVNPELFHAGFTLVGDTIQGGWGIGKAGAFTVFRLAIYAALVRLVLVWQRSTNQLEQRQALYVSLGFSLFIGFESMQDLLLFSEGALTGDLALVSLAFVSVSLLGLVAVIWTAHRLLQSPQALTGPTRKLAVGCLAGSVGLGLVSGSSLTWSVLPDLPAESVWRLGTVALLMSAVTRFEHLDPEHAVPTVAGVLGWFAVGAAALLTMHVGLSAVSGSSTFAFLWLQIILVLGAATVAWRRPGIFTDILRQLRRRRSSVGRARRDLEMYEAALLSDRATDVLTDLRSRISISTAEHEVMQQLTDPGANPTIPRERERHPGDLLDDRYQLESELGQGASSRVFRAYDEVQEREVAIKIPDPLQIGTARELREFLYEARVCPRLNHPNIVDAYELGHDEGWPYLTYELVEAGTLRSQLDGEGLPTREALHVVDGILAGLDNLHGEGLVHRDLKPSNVLVDEHGNAKISDLGLADTWDAKRTQTLGPDGAGLREGTPAYMSPEALLGHPPRPHCDVYAAGAILVEVLTGAHYLELDDAPYGTVKRAVLESPPCLHNVEPALVPICRKALARDLEDRYASAREMRRALRDAIEPGLTADRQPLLSEIQPPGERGQGLPPGLSDRGAVQNEGT